MRTGGGGALLRTFNPDGSGSVGFGPHRMPNTQASMPAYGTPNGRVRYSRGANENSPLVRQILGDGPISSRPPISSFGVSDETMGRIRAARGGTRLGTPTVPTKTGLGPRGMVGAPMDRASRFGAQVRMGAGAVMDRGRSSMRNVGRSVAGGARSAGARTAGAARAVGGGVSRMMDRGLDAADRGARRMGRGIIGGMDRTASGARRAAAGARRMGRATGGRISSAVDSALDATDRGLRRAGRGIIGGMDRGAALGRRAGARTAGAVRAVGGGISGMMDRGLDAMNRSFIKAITPGPGRNLGINMRGFGSTGPARTPMGPGATGGGLPRGTGAPRPRAPRSSGGRVSEFLSTKNGKGIAIGLGALVIAGAAMNRRGEGSSSGRTSMARY